MENQEAIERSIRLAVVQYAGTRNASVRFAVEAGKGLLTLPPSLPQDCAGKARTRTPLTQAHS